MEDSEIKLHERVTLTLKVSWRPVNFRDQRNIRQTDIVVKQMSVQGITLASAMDRRPNYYPPPSCCLHIPRRITGIRTLVLQIRSRN